MFILKAGHSHDQKPLFFRQFKLFLNLTKNQNGHENGNPNVYLVNWVIITMTTLVLYRVSYKPKWSRSDRDLDHFFGDRDLIADHFFRKFSESDRDLIGDHFFGDRGQWSEITFLVVETVIVNHFFGDFQINFSSNTACCLLVQQFRRFQKKI